MTVLASSHLQSLPALGLLLRLTEARILSFCNHLSLEISPFNVRFRATCIILRVLLLNLGGLNDIPGICLFM